MSLVVIEEHGPVTLLRLNRPEKLNALSTALERELEGALDDARVRAAGAVVIAGNERAFSAGADMSEMGETGAAGALAYYRDTGGVYERIARLPQPTIAAIRGWCLGGGFELALACDFRIADSAAMFGLPEVEIGIIPSSGGTVRLVKAIGGAAGQGAHPASAAAADGAGRRDGARDRGGRRATPSRARSRSPPSWRRSRGSRSSWRRRPPTAPRTPRGRRRS